MDKEPQNPLNRFFDSIYKNILAPLIVILLAAFITGKIVIQITGFQFSVGITLLIMLCIYIVMVLSFYLGMIFLVSLFFSLFMKNNMPRSFHVLSKFALIVLFPFLLYEKIRAKRYPVQQSEWTQQILQKSQEQTMKKPESR